MFLSFLQMILVMVMYSATTLLGVKSKHLTLITLQHRVCALLMPIPLPEFVRLPAMPFLQEDIIGAPGCNPALLACGGNHSSPLIGLPLQAWQNSMAIVPAQ